MGPTLLEFGKISDLFGDLLDTGLFLVIFCSVLNFRLLAFCLDLFSLELLIFLSFLKLCRSGIEISWSESESEKQKKNVYINVMTYSCRVFKD